MPNEKIFIWQDFFCWHDFIVICLPMTRIFPKFLELTIVKTFSGSKILAYGNIAPVEFR
jgi:hypothetical protein